MKILTALSIALIAASTLQAAPKKLLVVTTTSSFRHSSIPTAEKILAQLAKDSGEFTVDFVQQPPGHPAAGFPAKLKADATDADRAAFNTAEAAFNEKLKVVLQKMSPENLKNYDGVIFASTTGDLPLPDPQGFLNWIKAGHAFIGIHAASDTFHKWPDFAAMLGGEFATHGPQVGVECLNEDPAHPATAHLGKSWTIQREEIYQFKNYDATKVHDLLILDKHLPFPWPPFINGSDFADGPKGIGRRKRRQKAIAEPSHVEADADVSRDQPRVEHHARYPEVPGGVC